MQNYAPKQTATEVGTVQARLAEAKHWLNAARDELDRAIHNEKVALLNYCVCRDEARTVTGNEELE